MSVSNDPINHPKHYTNSGAVCSCGKPIECIDAVESMSFVEGNIIKYVWRHKDKNGVEDLKKARWYIDWLIRKYNVEREPERGCKVES